MTTKKIFGALGPAALVAAVGMGATGAAHALMIDGGTTGVTYAKETLRVDMTSSRTGDVTTYYDIVRPHMIVAPAQVRKTDQHDNERYTVSYELTGMVFAEALSQTSTPAALASSRDDVESSVIDDDPTNDDPTDDPIGDADYSLFAGGGRVTTMLSSKFPELTVLLAMGRSCLRMY